MNEHLFLMLNPLILLFITPLRTLHDNLRKTKLYFLKAQSLWKPICFSLNETGVPSQLSRCHFSWQLQDTLFTPVVECTTEGHPSFCEMKSHNRKHFCSYKKWFIWERHRDVISILVKGSRAGRSYEICLKPTLGKKIKNCCFNLKKHK